MKYVFVIFSLLVFTSFQQQKTDSLILLLKNTQSDTSLVNMYNQISVQFINTGSFVQAKKYVDSAFNIATLAQPSPAIKKGKASAYNIMGIIDYNQGNYPQALNNYYAALKIREEIGDKKGIGASYSNIGNIYDDQG
ncbi:MAG TPA: tetratricopeptide repeat protein, partial [Bacteroidia bacterium]